MGYRKGKLIDIPDDPAVLAYIAGIIDGEGYVGIPRSRTRDGRERKNVYYRIRVTITNSDARLLLWLQKTLVGGSVASTGYKNQAQNQHKPCWFFHLSGANCERLLVAVIPYLILKKEQALLCLEMRGTGKYCEDDSPSDNVVYMRDVICRKVRDLNKRGVA